jgi:protocatechuate 3,4-dioxygenase beta subunit
LVFLLPSWAVEQVVPGDLNQDEVTDHMDFFELTSQFDPSGHQSNPDADSNGDQRIDHRDVNLAILGRLLGRFGVPQPQLDQTGAVTGFVLSDTGDPATNAPLEGAHVWVGNGNGFRLRAETGPDGAFRFEGVPVGQIRVVASHPGYHEEHVLADVAAGQETTVTLLLPPWRDDLADLSGFVRGARVGDATQTTPLAGAAVRVLPLSDGEVVGDFDASHHPGEDDPHQVAFTNENGHYEIHDLPAGPYRVVVAARGFESQEREIEIAAEEQEHFEDFLLVPAVQRVGQVAGTVFDVNPLSARPSDPPLPGAKVVLERMWEVPVDPILENEEGGGEGDHPFPVPAYFAITDASGRYHIDGVLPGKYHARAWAADHHPDSATVEVAVGETTIQDFHLEVILEPGRGAVAGTVTGVTPGVEGAVPLEDAIVHLVPRMNEMETRPFSTGDIASAARVRSTTTDADGKYLFGEVPEGMYLVIAYARGWGVATGAASVIVGETAVVDLVIVHHPPLPPASLSGFVRGSHVPGGDAPPAPIPGAHVLVAPIGMDHPDLMPNKNESGEDHPHPFPFRTLTDENGHYEFPRLPPGPCKVLVLARGFKPQGQAADLPSGGSVTLDFLLEPLPSGPGAVMGTVFTQTSDGGPTIPVPGAHVRLVGEGLPFPDPLIMGGSTKNTNGLPLLVFETQTNAEGYFEFSPVPAGPYYIEVSAEGFRREHLPVFVAPGGEVTLDIQLFHREEGEGGALAGHVYQHSASDVESLDPIPGALVVAVPLPGGDFPMGGGLKNEQGPDGGGGNAFGLLFARTGPDGGYQFDHLPPGRVALLVVADGFEPGVGLVEIRNGETTVQDFFLNPSGGGGGEGHSSLAGMVTGHSDNPTFAPIWIANAAVILVPAIDPGTGIKVDGPGLTTHTNGDGHYEFPLLLPGNYHLYVHAEGYQPFEIPVGIPPQTHVEQDVELLPAVQLQGARLYGYVAQPDPMHAGMDKPVAGAVVRAALGYPEGDANMLPPRLVLERVTGENGYYEFEHLPAGPYTVAAFKPGYNADAGLVDLAEGDEAQEDFLLTPVVTGDQGGVVEGNITIQTPMGIVPAIGAIVRIRQIDNIPDGMQAFEAQTFTDDHGHYRFGHVPPGHSVVIVPLPFGDPLHETVLVVEGQVTQQSFQITENVPTLVQ